mmetsp:Transcript_18379/g.33773  ORF Transcript_18379/g.33773 Transcript_18379/m.33773 type:complete len:101 (-) Transcript_18379:184-486(-)
MGDQLEHPIPKLSLHVFFWCAEESQGLMTTEVGLSERRLWRLPGPGQRFAPQELQLKLKVTIQSEKLKLAAHHGSYNGDLPVQLARALHSLTASLCREDP